VKNQREFLNNFDPETVKKQKNKELEEINSLMPELFEEFDLIDKNHEEREEEIFSIEGSVKAPYQTKHPSVSMSENNSVSGLSVGSHDGGKSGPFDKGSSGSEESKRYLEVVKVAAGRPTVGHKPKRQRKSNFQDFDHSSALFQYVKFNEIKSEIISEEKKKNKENLKEAREQEGNLTSFEKKFSLEKGERLIDSFT
jgi:hypothetical protein